MKNYNPHSVIVHLHVFIDFPRASYPFSITAREQVEMEIKNIRIL